MIKIASKGAIYNRSMFQKNTVYVSTACFYIFLDFVFYCTNSLMICDRFRNCETLKKEATRLVERSPESISHIPDAISFLVNVRSIEDDAQEVNRERMEGDRGMDGGWKLEEGTRI